MFKVFKMGRTIDKLRQELFALQCCVAKCQYCVDKLLVEKDEGRKRLLHHELTMAHAGFDMCNERMIALMKEFE